MRFEYRRLKQTSRDSGGKTVSGQCVGRYGNDTVPNALTGVPVSSAASLSRVVIVTLSCSSDGGAHAWRVEQEVT